MTVFGHTTPTAAATVLTERLVTASELVEGRFEAVLDAEAHAEGWCVTHLCRWTLEDQRAYEELLKLAVEFGIAKATGPTKALLERFLIGEVTEDLLLGLGRAVRDGAGHPVAEFALKAAERDVYRVWWRARLGPAGILALLQEAETWAGMALDWTRA